MWTTATIAGKPADIFDLPTGTPTRQAVLFLHDLDGATLARSPVWTRLLEQHQLACVCPHGQQAWWSGKVCADFDPALTAEAHVLTNVVPFLRQRWGLAERAIGLSGLGMGGQGALRLALKHPRLFPVVAGLASALDCYEVYGRGTPLDDLYDSKEQCRQDTALLHLHPVHTPPHIFYACAPDEALWYRGNDRLHEKMQALGVVHQADLTTRAGGSAWQYAEQQAARVVAFLKQGLVEESRRLL